MPPTLRVDPPVLRAAALQEREVAAAVANSAANAALADAAARMPALHSADGCEAARTALDAAGRAVTATLADHAAKVEAAAQQYDSHDAALGRQLARFGR